MTKGGSPWMSRYHACFYLYGKIAVTAAFLGRVLMAVVDKLQQKSVKHELKRVSVALRPRPRCAGDGHEAMPGRIAASHGGSMRGADRPQARGRPNPCDPDGAARRAVQSLASAP